MRIKYAGVAQRSGILQRDLYMAVIKVWPVLASRILRSWLGESEARAGVQEPVTLLRKLLLQKVHTKTTFT